MGTMGILAVLALAAVGTGAALWRWRGWPCPARCSWLLDNPFMNLVAGADTLLARAGVEPGMKVLDAGCGSGRIAVPAARRVGPEGKVLGLDLQEAMLRRTGARARAAGIGNLHLLRAGLGEGKLPEGHFDRAFLVTVLGEVRDRPGALAEIFRALRPGGILSVTEVLPDPHYQTPRAVRALAAAAGFRESARFPGRLAYTLNLERPEGT